MTRFQPSARQRRRKRRQEDDWRPKTLLGWLGLAAGFVLFIPFLAIVFLAGFTLYGGWTLIAGAPTWIRWTAYSAAAVFAILIVVSHVDQWRRRR